MNKRLHHSSQFMMKLKTIDVTVKIKGQKRNGQFFSVFLAEK